MSGTDSDTAYGYVPTEWICGLFLGLFGLSTVIHLGQSIRFRLWWLIPTVVTCGITQLLGWSGRLWSSKNPTLLTPFLIQISTLGLAPTFFVAANFIIFGKIINRLGPQYSRIPPMLYTWIFCSVDLIALAVQGVGGGIASSAAADGTIAEADKGGHILLGGIAVQLAAIVIYLTLATEFFIRWSLKRPVRVVHENKMKEAEAGHMSPHTSPVFTPESSASLRTEHNAAMSTDSLDLRAKTMILGLGFSSVCILIRSIYRVIELSDGWNGAIITNEHYFNVLDGAMLVLSMFSLNVLHPGYLLK